MRRLTVILLAALLIPLYTPSAKAKMQAEGGGIAEDIIEEGPLKPKRVDTPTEEDYEEEEEFPEEEAPGAKPPSLPTKPVVAGEAGEGEELRQIVIDGLVNMNYVFNKSPDTFIVKYHLHLEGEITAAAAVVKGNASIASEVTGFLAKWPGGECKLVITTPDSPFEMTFRKSSEEKATVDLKFKSPIMETWESQCSFKDSPGAKFNTKGDPEKWLAKALEKARPPLTRFTMNLNPEEPTTTKFVIGKQMIKDPPLGSAEIEGTGVITINPGAGE